MARTISLHTADPGEFGANEISGDINYRRVETVWLDLPGVDPGDGSCRCTGGGVRFTIPDGMVATHFGCWNVSGDYSFGGPLDRPAPAGLAVITPVYVHREA
jgi:hypothetical protein